MRRLSDQKGRGILKELVKIPYMDVLILQDCGLKDLEFITANIRVYKLVASNNQIEGLPESWKRQNRLDKLELSGNPITGEALESEGGFEIRSGVYRMRGNRTWLLFFIRNI